MARMMKFFTNLLTHNGKIVKNPLTEAINSYPKQLDKLISQIDGIWFKIGPYDSMFDLLNENTEYLPTFGDSQRMPIAVSQKINNNCIANNSMLSAKTPNYKFCCNNTQKTMDGMISILKSNLKTTDINLEKEKLNSVDNIDKNGNPNKEIIKCRAEASTKLHSPNTDSEQKHIANKKKDQCQSRSNECNQFGEEVPSHLKGTECENVYGGKHKMADENKKPKDRFASTSTLCKSIPEGTDRGCKDISKEKPCSSGIPKQNTESNAVKTDKESPLNVTKCRNIRKDFTDLCEEIPNKLKQTECEKDGSGKDEMANESEKTEDQVPSTCPPCEHVPKVTDQGCKDTPQDKPCGLGVPTSSAENNESQTNKVSSDDSTNCLNKPNACSEFIKELPNHLKEIVCKNEDSEKNGMANTDKKLKDQSPFTSPTCGNVPKEVDQGCKDISKEKPCSSGMPVRDSENNEVLADKESLHNITKCPKEHNKSTELCHEVPSRLKEAGSKTDSSGHETVNDDCKPKDQVPSTCPPGKHVPKVTDQRCKDTSKDKPCGLGVPTPSAENNESQADKVSSDNSTNCLNKPNACNKFIKELPGHFKELVRKNEDSGKNEAANADKKAKDQLPSTSPTCKNVPKEAGQECKDVSKEQLCSSGIPARKTESKKKGKQMCGGQSNIKTSVDGNGENFQSTNIQPIPKSEQTNNRKVGKIRKSPSAIATEKPKKSLAATDVVVDSEKSLSNNSPVNNLKTNNFESTSSQKQLLKHAKQQRAKSSKTKIQDDSSKVEENTEADKTKPSKPTGEE